MTKRILLTSLIVLLTAGMLVCWFHFAGSHAKRVQRQALCRQVEVILVDSLESGIVDKQEVKDYLTRLSVGRQTLSIDLDSIEKALNSRGEIMSAQVYTADAQTVTARLTQRKPVIRLERGEERWYADPEGYLFPVTNTVDVPVVTGRLPLAVDASWRGPVPAENREWMEGMVALARYIDGREFLRREIAQIDIDASGDIVLYARSGGPAIIFGDSSDCAGKFRKLEAWWRNILPSLEGQPYKSINLKYNNQIICKHL